jgi:glycosyltransferase involved in cell wall biosynthesis
VDIDRFARFADLVSRDEARRALGWPQGRPTIVTVRRLVRAKGLENLITAVEAVRGDIPDLLLVIVGSGPLEAELKARVRDAALQNVVRFEGYVPEEALPNVYRAGDLFVVPTITLEGFGLVVIEALACGTPVLVTPIGGLPEVVSDLEPGLIFESVHPDHLARGIRDAFQGRIRIPGESECRTYAQRFDWPVIAKRVNSVYTEVVA